MSKPKIATRLQAYCAPIGEGRPKRPEVHAELRALLAVARAAKSLAGDTHDTYAQHRAAFERLRAALARLDKVSGKEGGS